MHRRLRKLWLNWSLLALGTLLAMTIGLGWLAQHAADRIAGPELKQASQLIGRAVAGDIERALSYRIPIDRLVAVDAWFAGLVKDNPIIGMLMLTDTGDKVLANVGGDKRLQDELLASARTHTTGYGAPDGPSMYVASLPLRSGNGKIVGWLHVGSTAGPLPRYGWWWSLAAALALTGIASLLLLRLLRQRLQRPLDDARIAVEAMAGGLLPHLPNLPVRDPATQYLSALAEHLHGLRRRNDVLLLKIGEVRSTHFDPDIVQTLDELAQPLAARRPPSPQAGTTTAAAGAGGSALRRALLATVAGTLVLAACGYGLHAQYQHADQRLLLNSGTQLLQQTWQAVLDQDRAELDEQIGHLLALPGLVPLIAGHDDQALQAALQNGAVSMPALAIFNPDGTLRAAIGQRKEAARIDPLTLALLRHNDPGARTVRGVWQNGVLEYRSGVARRIDANGRPALILMARPLESSVRRLQTRLQETQRLMGDNIGNAVQTAAVDLRGHPLADADALLAGQWSEQGRGNFILAGSQAAMVVSIGLNAPSGHPLGTLLARQPLPPRLNFFDDMLILLCASLALACMAALLLYLRIQFAPLASATRQLERLADGDTDEQEAPQDNRESRLLHRTVRRIAEKIDALETLRRSRDRQGKRQARFIRRQMMQLAERLDAAARRGILEDLQRIEHARRPQEDRPAGEAHNERTERIADEFGVLALGFQNLVSRVGEQYQELDRLVGELREALRTKTQFIALQQELEIARKMQLSILPHQFAANPALSLHATMQPAKEVGGDFYDFFNLDEHRVALVVADVSGKGVPAAFFMAISRTLLRAVAPYADSAAECIGRVNDLLAGDNEEMMFVTLFYAILDTRDGTLLYINAGHNLPFLLHADGRIGQLAATRGIALAVAADMYFQQGRIVLQPGDGLFLYTDGITEATDPAEQLFGESRLAETLRGLTGQPVEQITAQVVERTKQFEAGSPQADDITCMMVRYGHPT